MTLLQGIVQISEEMAVAMEEVVFSTHLAIASSAVICSLLPLDDLIDLVSQRLITNLRMNISVQTLRYRHIGSEEASSGACLASLKAWQTVAEKAEPSSYSRSE